MSKIQHQLTRKCIACGETKPLMAFLQQGGSYGNTCATCKTKGTGSDDERGSTSKGQRIDDKARLLAEQEQQRQAETKNYLIDETLEKREKLADEKQKLESTNITEKKQRENYLEVKKTLMTTPSRREEPVALKTAAETRKKQSTDSTMMIGQQQEQQNLHQKQAEQQQRQDTTIDYTVPFIAPLSHAKFSAPDQLRLMRWLGNSNPLTKSFEQAFGQKGAPVQSSKPAKTETPANAPTEKKSADWARTFEQHYRATSQSSQSTSQKQDQQKKESVSERVEQSMGPSSQRKR